MSWVNVLLIYILFWWVTLFAILPWGVRGQAEEDNVVPGSEPGAPVSANMKKKVVVTTIVSAILCAIFLVIDYFDLIDITKLSPLGTIE
ncbi:MAG: DUF1467 family protein [Hellea sp.]|nr:DUF1467 family protein [Hellea sp.]